MHRLPLFLGVTCLAACTTPPRYKPLCPPLVHYTAQEQKQAAAELKAHPELQEIPSMLRDYGNFRRAVKALGR